METNIKLLSTHSITVRDMMNCSSFYDPLTKEQLDTVVSYLGNEDKNAIYLVLYKTKGLLGLFELLNIADFLNIQSMIVDTCKKIEEMIVATSTENVRKHLKENNDLNEECRRSLRSSYEWL